MFDLENIIDTSLRYYAERQDSVSEEELQEKRSDLRKIAANTKLWFLNFVAKYHKILIPSLENVTLLSADMDANPYILRVPGKPIVFIANHVSNFDSPILGLHLYLNDYPYPIIAAGKNLFTNSASSFLLKSGGAFELKRDIPNREYMDFIGSYLRASLEENIPTMIFPEDGRSRDGKLKEFKRGLIGLVLHSFFENQKKKNPKIDDVVFVPIGIAYTKVPEDTYFFENESSRAQRGLFKYVLKMRKCLEPTYVRIGRPISLKDYFAGSYPPLEEELKGEVSKDFAAYLRSKVRMTIPLLESDVFHHAMHAYIEEQSTDTVHFEGFRKRVSNFRERIHSEGYHIIPAMERTGDFFHRMRERLNEKELSYYGGRILDFFHFHRKEKDNSSK